VIAALLDVLAAFGVLLAACTTAWVVAWLVELLPGERGRVYRARRALRARHDAALRHARGDKGNT
jgi:hypothetical protein